jgi:hypothetical protein
MSYYHKSSSLSNSPNWNRNKYDYEIPTEQNKEHTKKIIEKQDKIPGQKRDDEIVMDYPEAAAMGRILMDIGFSEEKKGNPICRKTTRLSS